MSGISADQIYSVSNNFPPIKSSDRILIISPHPDDESLATAGIIKEASDKNANVLVVEMTSGENMDQSNYQKYLNKTKKLKQNKNIGEMRQIEVKNALKSLGIDQKSIIFLGYPDGSLKSLFEEYWSYDNLLTVSKDSSKTEHSPYNSTYEINAPYCGANVAKNLVQIINDYQPTIIIYPDGGDYHPDHFGTSAFVKYAIIRTNYTGKCFTYLVHYPNWPSPPYLSPLSNLSYPNIANDTEWKILPLDSKDKKAKQRAIEAYKSQLIVNNTYYYSFVRTNELYAPYTQINMERMEINNSIMKMPNSSYSKMEMKTIDGKEYPTNQFTTFGVAYDDQNIYLLTQTPNMSIDQDLTYHIKIFQGDNFNDTEIKIKNGNALSVSVTNHTINSIKLLDVNYFQDLMIITIPHENNEYNNMMISLEYTHQLQNYRDSLPWIVYSIP
jgi:LmbE family N-acetylglucosaminyl deacetylase